MSITKSTTVCLNYSSSDLLDSFDSFHPTWKVLTSDVNEAISQIDDALEPLGRSNDRTSFADADFARSLPTPAVFVSPDTPLALRTFERIRDMLVLDDQQTAALVDVSRNTPRDWRRGNQPRAATTQHLYELAGVLDLVATQHQDMAAWARGLSPEGRTWLDLFGEPGGPAIALRHLRRTLLARRPALRLEIDGDDDRSEVQPAIPTSGLVERAGRRRRAR